MAINLKIIAISVVVGALIVGGAGYFYISKIRPKTAQKESITKVTGGPTGKVEVLGRTGSEESRFPPPLAELEKKIEQIRLRGFGATEPEAPKLLKTEEGFEFMPEKILEKEKPSEIQVFPVKPPISPPVVSKPSLLAPNQYSSREEFKKEAEKYYSDTYIKSLVLMQDALISAGHLKESDRTPLKNENDVRDFWRKFANFVLSQADLSSLPQEERNIIENAKEIDVSRIMRDFVGFSGEGSVIPLGTAIAESVADRLEFSSDSNFTEEELVKHFYPVFYLGRLLSSQEEMISAGFIKPEERVLLKTRKEVEWLMLKEVEYSELRRKGSGEIGKSLQNNILTALPRIQLEEVNKISSYLQGKSSKKDDESFVSAQIEFILRLGDLIGTFLGMLMKPANVYAQDNPIESTPPECSIGWSFYTPNVQLGIGAIVIGGPMVVEVGEDCWRSVIHDADPYGACDWRACLYWGPPAVVPIIFEARTNWGCDTIPPGQCYIPGQPSYFFPTRCCVCLREDVCAVPPFISPPYPWGCHALCPLNLIWDEDTNICGCGI